MHTVKTPWDRVTAVDLLHALTVPIAYDKIDHHQRNPLVAPGIYPHADRVDACEYVFRRVKEDVQFKMLLQSLSPAAQTILKGAFTLPEREDSKSERTPGPSKEPIPITLLPTRGPAMEFFGYFSETCISSEHFLPVTFPKVSAIYFVKKDSPATTPAPSADEPWQGTPWGGTLLAITETETGERAAVLYAFNPSSKALKAVDAGSLFEEVKEAIISRMKELDVRYLLLPKDDYPQFTLTNRPAILAYLKEKYLDKGLPEMRLRQSGDTAVVDLPISERTIVLHDRGAPPWPGTKPSGPA
jgi:hypothetical protein